MKRKLTATVLLASLAAGLTLQGCDSARLPDRNAGNRTPAESANSPTPTPTPAPADTSTPTPTLSPTPTSTPSPSPTPAVITETTYLYDGFVVHTDWSNYTPYSASSPESVYTRLREDYIDEFYPSDEYGYVFPFTGMESTGTIYPEEDTSLFGLCDMSGRIVCDPVFYSINEIDDYGIYITTTIDNDTGIRKYGILKKDGTFYSGQIYDDYNFTPTRLIMIKRQSDKILATAYDHDCGTIVPEREILIDFSSLELPDYVDIDYTSESFWIIGLLSDGHAVFSEYFSGQIVIIDGNSGEILNNGLYDMSEASGDVFFARHERSTDSGWIILSSSGDEITSAPCEFVTDLGDGTYLIYEQGAGNSQIIDSAGNILREIPGRTLFANGSFYSYQDGHTVIYDRDMQETGTVENNLGGYQSFDSYIRNSGYHLGDASDSDLFISSSNIYCPRSGIRVTRPSSDMYIHPSGNGLLIFSNEDGREWSLYNCELELLSSGRGYANSCTDSASGITYILNNAHDVIDASTGEVILTLDTNGSDISDFDVHGGLIYYETDDGMFIVNFEGETVFHYNPVIWDPYV